MSSLLCHAVRAGALGFAGGLLLALLFAVRPELALIRAGLAGLITAGAVFLAVSLNLTGPKAEEDQGLSSGSADQSGT